MNCTQVHNLLSEYLDGEIQGSAREKVEEHLAQCASCARAFAVLQSASRLLAEAREVEPPIGLLEQIEAATINRPSLGQRVLGRLAGVPASARWAMASAVAAAAVVIAMVSSPSVQQIAKTPVPNSKPHVTATQPSTPTQPAVEPKKAVAVAVTEVKPAAAPKSVQVYRKHPVRMAKAPSHRFPAKPASQSTPKVAQIPNADVDAAKNAEPIPVTPPEEHVVAVTPPASETPQEVQIVRVSNVPQPDWTKREADSLAELNAKLAAKNKQRRYEAHSEPLEGRKVSINLASIRF